MAGGIEDPSGSREVRLWIFWSTSAFIKQTSIQQEDERRGSRGDQGAANASEPQSRDSDEYELEEARKLIEGDGSANGHAGKLSERNGYAPDFPEQPSQVSLTAVATKRHAGPLPAWALIIVWIALSTAVIFQNANILKSLDFPFPITLTSIHLVFQTVLTRVLARYTDLIPPAKPRSVLPISSPVLATSTETGAVAPSERSGYLASGDQKLDVTDFKNPIYWKTIVPIGLLFSLSLVLSNYVYMFLSVSFIQMIKAASPVAVLIASFVFGLRSPTLKLVAIICSISTGVAIASYGEADFNLYGFLIQCTAIAIEASRLALIEILLSGVGLSPLQSLHAFAPVCLGFLGLMVLPFEGLEPFSRLSNLGLPLIVLNASLTCALNLSSIYLIGISSIVLSLSKVAKDIMIIFASALVLGTPITPLQWFGYAFALGGLYVYKTYA